MGWPRRRISSVLGGVFTVRTRHFGGRRPYHFHDERQPPPAGGSWWMDPAQAATVRRVTD